MAVQLGHKALAERHDFTIGLALRVKIGAALAAADRQAGQGVLEDLLKAQELDDAQVHRGMEAQAALVRTDGRVKLHTEAAVHLYVAVVVNPRHAEHDLTLRLEEALQKTFLLVLRILLNHNLKGVENLGDSLMELRLARILLDYLFQLFAYIGHGRFTSYNRTLAQQRSI